MEKFSHSFGRPETFNENESKTKFEFSVRPFCEISESKSPETPLELSEQNILVRKELPQAYTPMYAKR